MAWNRWNTGSHIFEYSTDLGVTWLPLPIKASATYFEDQIPVHSGGTGSDLSATGGPGKVLKQKNIGDSIVVERLTYDELFGDQPDTTRPGVVQAFAGPSSLVPNGYLLCDGTAVSRTIFARLFGIIGILYGAGDTSTTFNLPDLRQKFPLGLAASGTGSVLGGSGGAIDHTHTSAAHTHTVPALSISTDGSHSHSGTTGNISNGVDMQTGGGHNVADNPHTHNFTTDTQGSHNHTGSTGTGSSGSTTPANTGSNNPPFLAMNYIIKT